MEIVVSVFAVLVGLACLLVLVRAGFKDRRRKKELADSRPSDEG